MIAEKFNLPVLLTTDDVLYIIPIETDDGINNVVFPVYLMGYNTGSCEECSYDFFGDEFEDRLDEYTFLSFKDPIEAEQVALKLRLGELDIHGEDDDLWEVHNYVDTCQSVKIRVPIHTGLCEYTSQDEDWEEVMHHSAEIIDYMIEFRTPDCEDGTVSFKTWYSIIGYGGGKTMTTISGKKIIASI